MIEGRGGRILKNQRLRWGRGKSPEWIPVKSGLVPVDDSVVLVTYTDGFVDMGIFEKYDDYIYVNGKYVEDTHKVWRFTTVQGEYYGYEPDENCILAWAYLPEPYEPDDEDFEYVQRTHAI